MRGLSALFWGLPVSLVLCVHTGLKNRLEVTPWDLLLPVVANGILLYGASQLRYFRREERNWVASVERTRMLALVLTGLSPFLCWRIEVPDARAFQLAVILLAAGAMMFLFYLNQLLLQLSLLLPEEALRHETRLFTSLNFHLIAAIPVGLSAIAVMISLANAGILTGDLLKWINRSSIANQWVFLLLALLPVATTMALIWKTKEVIFTSVFGAPR